MTISADCGTWTTAGFAWPYPRAFFLEHYTLAVAPADYSVCQGGAATSTTLCLFELTYAYSSWTATAVCSLGAVADIESIEIADFGPFYVVSVGEVLGDSYEATNYMRDTTSSRVAGATAEISDSDIPQFAVCCSFQGQLVVGGITESIAYDGYSDWENLSHAHLAWSGVNNWTFRQEDDRTAGFCKVLWAQDDGGKVLKLHRIANKVMVFGNSGLMNLTPFSQNVTSSSRDMVVTSFSPQYVKGNGIKLGNHVAGDDHVVLFINRDKDLCMSQDGQQVERLGYREWMEDLDIDDTIVSYVPQKKMFFISDGETGFAMSEYGLYTTNQLVSSAGVVDGNYLGFFGDSEDYEGRFTTNTIDFQQRGKKTLEAIEFGIAYAPGELIRVSGAPMTIGGQEAYMSAEEVSGVAYGSVDYKNAYNQMEFTNTSWKKLNPNGIVWPIVTADDFRIRMKVLNYRNADFELNYIKTRTKMVDKRSIRGMYNAG